MTEHLRDDLKQHPSAEMAVVEGRMNRLAVSSSSAGCVRLRSIADHSNPVTAPEAGVQGGDEDRG